MASRKLYIIDSQDGSSDGVLKNKDKVQLGRAWNQEAPVGTFISISLEDYWVISDEELKEYKQLKKQHEKI